MKLLLGAFMFCLLAACGGKPQPVLPVMPKPAPVEDPSRIAWHFQPQGLRVLLKTDKTLNMLDDTPHALSLCLYQLRDRKTFDTLMSSNEGLLTLLECTLIDDSIASAKRYFIQPGKEDVFFADRSENARYLAVVAGYHSLAPENCVKVVAMPIHTDVEGLFFKTYLYSAADMDAFLTVSTDAVNLIGAERKP